MKFRGFVCAFSFAASAVLSGGVTPAGAAEGLGVGACVTIKQQPGPAKIVALTPGGYIVQEAGKARSEAMNWAREDVSSGPCPGAPSRAQVAMPHSCFASDPAGGGPASQRADRDVIRSIYVRPAEAGSDGAVTLHFVSFRSGASRAWRRSDGYNFSADTSKPVHELRVVFTTCTDWHTAIQLLRRERNFECFTAPTGEHVCQVSGSTGGMLPDKRQYIPK